MSREELVEFLVGDMGICGCSTEDRAVKFLLDMLEVGDMRQKGFDEEADAVLEEMLPDGDCIGRNLPVYWLMASGLAEHGWQIDAYTLTELGDLVLGALRAHGSGPELWEDSGPVDKRMVN